MKIRKRIFIMLSLICCLATVLTGCGNGGGQQSGDNDGKDPSEVLVLKVGQEEVYLNEVNYYALSFINNISSEQEINLDAYYNQEYPTMDDAYKAQLLLQIRQSKILYLKAIEEGLELTEEEEKDMEDLADQFIAAYDADTLEKYGIDRDLLVKMYFQVGLIQKLENQVASEVEVEDISYGTIENLVFLTIELDDTGNAVVNEDGSYVFLSEAEQTRQKENAEEAVTRLQNGEEAEALIEEYEIGQASGTVHATTDSLRETYHLSDGEVSDVIENDFGYTVVQVLTLEDEDYTAKVKAYNLNTAVQDAVNEKETEWMDDFVIEDDDLIQNVWDDFTFHDFI